MSDQSTEAFLLGLAMAGLDAVQKHLIQGENKEALSTINEAVRKLNEEVNKHFYTKEKGEVANVPA
jgi:hypothetical protein